MTSDTAKSETTLDIKPATKPDTFRSHLPAIVAATTGTVLAAILGSLIGTAGTVAGMVVGSLASGTCSWWAERGIRRSTALAATRAEALRARGYHLHHGETAVIATEPTAAPTRDTATAVTQDIPAAPTHDTAAGATQDTKDTKGTQNTKGTQDTAAAAHDTRAAVKAAGRGRHGRPGSRRRWAGPAAFIGTAFIGCALVVTMLEGAAGKPLSAVVQGKPGHGTTFGGGAVGKAAPASPSPTPSGSRSSTPAASVTGTATSPAPTGASASPSGSATPTATTPTSPVSGTPIPTPTPTGAAATPTGAATAG